MFVVQGEVVCLGNNEVKSRAVVKYSAAPPPATYALLQEKTDLKLPPANWLRESAQLGPAGTTVLGSSSKSKPFSRFVSYTLIYICRKIERMPLLLKMKNSPSQLTYQRVGYIKQKWNNKIAMMMLMC